MAKLEVATPEESPKAMRKRLGSSYDNLIVPDEDENDFCMEISSLHELPSEQLHNMWRVFTAQKTDSAMESRRLENMAWRIVGMRKAGLQVEKDISLDVPIVPIKEFRQKETFDNRLMKVAKTHNVSKSCVDDIVKLIVKNEAVTKEIPELTPEEVLVRPKCALFTHSMQRNGANNFCLFLVQKLCKNQGFVVFTPKDGPMVKDFMNLGLEVITMKNGGVEREEQLTKELIERNIGMILANTIMQCDIVSLASQLNIATMWMIHESWPKDKLEYYAQEVFLRKDLTKDKIEQAFKAAECVIFPSKMQMELYKGLYRQEAAHTIYNGIPWRRLATLSESMNREKIRSKLGYSSSDFLVLHIGTICGRKGQKFTAQASSKLIQEKGCKNLKTLLVGARYIRDHEVKYINSIKEIIESSGLSWSRWEELEAADRGKTPFTIMDIQSDVLRYYIAADVVVVPSLNEVLPLVICEAMALKKPVICSSIDAIPEAVSNGVEGLLIPAGDADALADAILKIYENEDLKLSLGENGRKRVETQFSYDVMCARWRELMDKFYEESRTKVDLSKKTILVDMDNTIVDWDAEFIKRYANASNIEAVTQIVRNRSHFEIELNFPEAERDRVLEIVQEPGFYTSLEPIPGAIEALKELLAEGVDVRLLTSPHRTCPASCASEKYKFLEKHLGQEWIPRLIIASDKTYMYGDVLIDDKPRVTGAWKRPYWKHLLYSQSYNMHVKNRPRMNGWENWKRTILDSLK